MTTRNELGRDIRKLTDTELVDYVTMQSGVTPLENEMARRLENFVAVFGDLNEGGLDAWR